MVNKVEIKKKKGNFIEVKLKKKITLTFSRHAERELVELFSYTF